MLGCLDARFCQYERGGKSANFPTRRAMTGFIHARPGLHQLQPPRRALAGTLAGLSCSAGEARPDSPLGRHAHHAGAAVGTRDGGLLVYTVMPDGNPACASYDGRACLWGVGYAQVDFSRVRPLVCGQAHRALYQVTGYEDPKHWCSVARRLRARN